MKVITARNVSEALVLGLTYLKEDGVVRDSRNGPVTVFPGPVTTQYLKPKERVLFYPERDCNPYFHFMESLWMMAGRRDVEWISRFSSNIANFSDDGVTFHGAYGWRWRNHFLELEEKPDGIWQEIGVLDQLTTIAESLRANKDDRRIVLQMWDASADLGMIGKDFPCNVVATFRVNPYGSLDMTVFNRSNDMIWGAYGANAVHFSVLQEVMASWVGVPVGTYWQVSTNFHAYHNTLNKHGHVVQQGIGFDPYQTENIKPFPIVNGPIEKWFQDLHMFMDEGPVMGLSDPFFKKVAGPMYQSWTAWKNRDDPDFGAKAMKFASEIVAEDWRKACMEWIERRMK